MDTPDTKIQIKNLTIGFHNHILLRNVSTKFVAKTLTALIGRNGTGKSTLLCMIAGLSDKYSGDIAVDGLALRHASPTQIATRMAYVGTGRQRTPAMRCRDIVAMGRAPYTNWIGHLSQHDNAIIDCALSDVDMNAYAHRMIDTLSDGEYQRIMIARALAQDTSVLLLDEPTSFLDIPNRFALCRLLAKLAHKNNKCILFSTHELDIALKTADNIALITDNTLINAPTAQFVSTDILTRTFAVPIANLENSL